MIPSVSPEADWELIEEATYYARQGGAELGNTFITKFERVLALLCLHPKLGAEWRNRRRRFSLRKFPFSVIYYVRNNEVRVVALAHHRRKPGYGVNRK
ncbi:MAG TPA: type II toxin-antitoxin system RelE/ParE family toxin [Burkholderiales bacterium]|nr:type II toxin-antitoxin system RelE/ParE family toxin [Burkholderiales bacterium]